MNETILKLENLITHGLEYLTNASEVELSHKPSPKKWSKKEIIGHLIDSGINNLQRFTEIQFEPKPYTVRKYYQDELVAANDYQHADTKKLIQFWVSLNYRISEIMSRQTEETLAYPINLYSGGSADLRFLMVDYVDHFEHHMKQIVG